MANPGSSAKSGSISAAVDGLPRRRFVIGTLAAAGMACGMVLSAQESRVEKRFEAVEERLGALEGRFERIEAALLRLMELEPPAEPPGQPTRSPMAGDQGYHERPCGFDLDDDGITGEEEDCQIGDGVTRDPDGDGIFEDILYVDCDRGSDKTGTGSPKAPYRTIGHAFALADGPADGAEDIIAFRGICRNEEAVTPRHGGIPRISTRSRRGNEVRDWQFPADPAMLIGWDTDDDGEYPPFDPDDIAVIDGSVHHLQRAFFSTRDHLEIAHHTVTGYAVGRKRKGPAGYWNGDHQDHVYLHDLSLRDILRDACISSSSQVINQFSNNTWFAVENVECLDCGGYFTRGATKIDQIYGPLRYQNMTVVFHGSDGDTACEDSTAGVTQIADFWGGYTGIEFMDNVFDGNLGSGVWTPNMRGPGGIEVSVCSRDWDIVNNVFYDVRGAFHASGTEGGYCGDPEKDPVRTTGDIRVEGNLYYHDHTFYEGFFARLKDYGSFGATRLEDVRLTNNVAAAGPRSSGLSYFVEARLENPDPGMAYTTGVTITGNTFYAGHPAKGYFFGLFDKGMSNQMERWEIRDNLVAGLSQGAYNIRTSREPKDWHSGGNVFDPDASFWWAGRSLGAALPFWRQATGQGEGSVRCDVAFVDVAAGDFHLAANDDCVPRAGDGVSDPP